MQFCYLATQKLTEEEKCEDEEEEQVEEKENENILTINSEVNVL